MEAAAVGEAVLKSPPGATCIVDHTARSRIDAYCGLGRPRSRRAMLLKSLADLAELLGASARQLASTPRPR